MPSQGGNTSSILVGSASFIFHPPASNPGSKQEIADMTFVVVENCIKCKYTDCVEVCPVDCFHEGPNFLVIDPEECIDCTLCEPECPAEAIYPDDSYYRHWVFRALQTFQVWVF